MTYTRQLQRSKLRALVSRGDSLLKNGLTRECEFRDLAAATLSLLRTLEICKTEGSIEPFMTKVHTFHRSTEKNYGQAVEVACKKGCNWCCHTTVSATGAEIIHAAKSSEIASRIAQSDALRTQSVISSQLIGVDRLGRKIPCAMLTHAGCSAYLSRPLMCRVATSLDVRYCVDEFEGHKFDEQIPVAVAPIRVGSQVRSALVAALELAKLDDSSYELSGGLLEFSSGRGIEQRFLSGRQAFQSTVAMPTEPTVHVAVRQLGSLCQQLIDS